MQKKAFVLLSGGLDSTTCLYKAIHDFAPDDLNGGYKDLELIHSYVADGGTIDWVEAVSIDYGQRHIKEAEQAHIICDQLGIKHSIINLKGIMDGPQVMLTDRNVDVPNISYDEIKGVSPTYVPFRNGAMLAALTAHAQKYVMGQISEDQVYNDLEDKEYSTAKAKDLVGIYFGAHAEDAHNWAYPDCTPEFVGAMANAIYIGTYFTVRLFTPFLSSSKADIITTGKKLGVPYELTWSCYKGEKVHCGECPTCRARKESFRAAGVEDPTVYKMLQMTPDQIKHMVNRFLTWKLPEDFHPDNGISFDPILDQYRKRIEIRKPVGTNLLTATQATAMVEHMLEGLPDGTE